MIIDTDINMGPVLMRGGGGVYQPAANPTTGTIDLKRAGPIFFTFETEALIPTAPAPPTSIPTEITVRVDSDVKDVNEVQDEYVAAACGWYTGKITPDANGDFEIKTTRTPVASIAIPYNGTTYHGVRWDGRDQFGMLLLPGQYTVFITPTPANIAGGLVKISIGLPKIYHIGGYNLRTVAATATTSTHLVLDDFTLRAEFGNTLQFRHHSVPQNEVIEIRNTLPNAAIQPYITQRIAGLSPTFTPRERAGRISRFNALTRLVCNLGTATQCSSNAIKEAFEYGACTLVSGHGSPTSIEYYANDAAGNLVTGSLDYALLRGFGANLSLKDNTLILFSGCVTAQGTASLTELVISQTRLFTNPGNLAIGCCQSLDIELAAVFFKKVFKELQTPGTSIATALTNATAYISPIVRSAAHISGSSGNLCKLFFENVALSNLPFTPVRHFFNISPVAVNSTTYAILPPPPPPTGSTP